MSGRLVGALALSLAVVTGAGFAVSAHDNDTSAHGRHASSRFHVGHLRVRPPVGHRVAVLARRTGIPAPAVRAYARAQRLAPPGCHVGWTTLAGIGWVESQHGTLGGRTLRADGRSSTAIIGPALDGHGSFAAIRATAGSAALHGDPRWEHAVGPMQFLPSTWAVWASDGDGDGRADVLDLDDAAAGTARYLCAGGGDLATAVGWQKAVLSYNHSSAYVADVYAAASAYAGAVS